MRLARILYPIKVLGPGQRIGIWFGGCPHRCPGCSNPELWNPEDVPEVRTEEAVELIETILRESNVDGFTLTGGDPFYQPEALKELLSYLASKKKNILVYTGYTYEELEETYPELLSMIDILIDGRYVEEKNRGQGLIGSENQRIICKEEAMQAACEAYKEEMRGRVQNFSTSDGIISLGIHLPGYEKALDAAVAKRGLEGT